MQKLFNLMAVFSFGVSTAILVGGYAVYSSRDTLLMEVKDKAMEEVKLMIPELIKESMGGVEVPEVGVEPPSLPSLPGL